MCYGCWQEYGSPQIINPQVVMACGLARKVEDLTCNGGNLHIQLEDWNIEDEHWDKYEIYDEHTTGQQRTAEEACFEAFKNLTLEERASALALREGYFEVKIQT